MKKYKINNKKKKINFKLILFIKCNKISIDSKNILGLKRLNKKFKNLINCNKNLIKKNNYKRKQKMMLNKNIKIKNKKKKLKFKEKIKLFMI